MAYCTNLTVKWFFLISKNASIAIFAIKILLFWSWMLPCKTLPADIEIIFYSKTTQIFFFSWKIFLLVSKMIVSAIYASKNFFIFRKKFSIVRFTGNLLPGKYLSLSTKWWIVNIVFYASLTFYAKFVLILITFVAKFTNILAIEIIFL